MKTLELVFDIVLYVAGLGLFALVVYVLARLFMRFL